MSQDLSVHGFGAVITVEEVPRTVFASGDDLGDPARRAPLSYDEFGTRHRSMMRYCDYHAGSVGFVVSQDGDVRVMTKVGKDLLVWDGVRLEMVLPEPRITDEAS